MKNLLISLKGKFRHVIIDSPPAISFTDAAILSTIVDGVVLVAMANKKLDTSDAAFQAAPRHHRRPDLRRRLNGIKSGSVEYEYYGAGYYNYSQDSDE